MFFHTPKEICRSTAAVGLWLVVLALLRPAAPVVAAEKISKQKLRELWPLWRGNRTTSQVVDLYGLEAHARLRPYFRKAGVPYPPKKITLLALKEERRLEMWARHRGKWRHIRDYKIMGASGHAGPKKKQGDKQVPEGHYRMTLLNPNSRYHVSIKLNYPNAFDRKYGRLERRSKLGGDIFIHGTSYSIGCLAMGNPVSEELFVLTAKVGLKNFDVLIAPYDFRRYKPRRRQNDPQWVDILYRDIQKRMAGYTDSKHRLGDWFSESTGSRKKAVQSTGKRRPSHPADPLSQFEYRF